MKTWILLALTVVLFSCNEGDNSENKEQNEAIDMNGPDVEINILSFSIEDKKSEIEVINRTDKNLKSVRGRLIFIDEKGEQVMTNTGNPITYPFQKASNTSIVDSRSKTVFDMTTSIDSRASTVEVTDIVVETTGGEKIEY